MSSVIAMLVGFVWQSFEWQSSSLISAYAVSRLILSNIVSRTVEINNTDAEGRLVLADGVVYALRDLKADLILDMATLTAAQVSFVSLFTFILRM